MYVAVQCRNRPLIVFLLRLKEMYLLSAGLKKNTNTAGIEATMRHV